MRENWRLCFPAGPGTGAWELDELRGALAQLEDLERWMLQRMFWEGRVQGEIARELGVSQPAVCKRKRQVLDKLRRFLTISRRRHKNRL
jgi:DNA-directed RNA polymerase specialized sigma subunit